MLTQAGRPPTTPIEADLGDRSNNTVAVAASLVDTTMAASTAPFRIATLSQKPQVTIEQWLPADEDIIQ